MSKTIDVKIRSDPHICDYGCGQKCHFKYGHRDSWCTTGKLSALVCERIIKIKIKGVIND